MKLGFRSITFLIYSCGVADAEPKVIRNPTDDVEEQDVVAKVCILAATAFGHAFTSDQVIRRGITEITLNTVQQTVHDGYRIKLAAAVRPRLESNIAGSGTPLEAHVEPLDTSSIRPILEKTTKSRGQIMNFKGMRQLRKYVPDLNSTRGRIRIGLYALGLFLLVTYYFLLTDQIPTWSIDSQIIVIALGFLILSLFFSRRKAYQEKYKGLAYRNAFAHYAIPGLALIFAAIAHAGYMNGPAVPKGWWTIIFVVLGWFLLITGALLWVRSILTFGADNLALLYVYHPEEGRMIDSSIYGILRHPIYAGVLRVGIGLALLNGNANALVFALLLPLGFTGWVRLVEEKELIQRFGQSYIEFRKHVPAFWPKWRDLGTFFKFLFYG